MTKKRLKTVHVEPGLHATLKRACWDSGRKVEHAVACAIRLWLSLHAQGVPSSEGRHATAQEGQG